MSAYPAVTNCYHQGITIDDPVARFLLTHLDGTRDRAALVDLLTSAVHAGTLQIDVSGVPITTGENAAEVLDDLVGHHLDKIRDLALLRNADA